MPETKINMRTENIWTMGWRCEHFSGLAKQPSENPHLANAVTLLEGVWIETRTLISVEDIVIPLENLSYTVKKILKGYSFEGLY